MYICLNGVTVAVIDHGVAGVEMIMEEALQDIPPLVKDIQERLRCMSLTTPHHSFICITLYEV